MKAHLRIAQLEFSLEGGGSGRVVSAEATGSENVRAALRAVGNAIAGQPLDWDAATAERVVSAGVPRARRSDPLTSHAAAAKVATAVKDHETLILAAIKAAGERGATYKEAAIAARMEPVVVGRRLKGMERQGLIARRLLPAVDTEHGDYEQRNGCAIWRAIGEKP